LNQVDDQVLHQIWREVLHQASTKQ
jgi:hypothetical protein